MNRSWQRNICSEHIYYIHRGICIGILKTVVFQIGRLLFHLAIVVELLPNGFQPLTFGIIYFSSISKHSISNSNNIWPMAPVVAEHCSKGIANHTIVWLFLPTIVLQVEAATTGRFPPIEIYFYRHPKMPNIGNKGFFFSIQKKPNIKKWIRKKKHNSGEKR